MIKQCQANLLIVIVVQRGLLKIAKMKMVALPLLIDLSYTDLMS